MLYLVATPIGNSEDITLRAVRLINECDLLIGEERKSTAQLLKSLNIQKKFELLNEHSDTQDIEFFTKECKTKTVALVTDAGTPSFHDPGFQLVESCRKNNIPVSPIPGASSLTTLISMTSQKLEDFRVYGFLPKDSDSRKSELKKLKKECSAFVLMDTPYRLERLLSELSIEFGNRKALLGIDMTGPNELYIEDQVFNLPQKAKGLKEPFMILIYP